MSEETETNDEFESVLKARKEPDAKGAIPEFKAEAKLGDANEVFDHSVEENARREREKELGVQTPSYPTAVPTQVVNSHVMIDVATGGLFGQNAEGEKIEVTPSETERFLRCALNDTEMYFDVQPIANQDITIRVAVPTEAFTSYAGALVDKWEDNTNSLQWIFAMQQAHVWFTVRSIDGVPTPWSDIFLDGIPPLKTLVGILREPSPHMDSVFNMNSIRWRMLMEAVRISEMKLKICLAAWRKRDFFGSGDTE